jgi:hypothetical protein
LPAGIQSRIEGKLTELRQAKLGSDVFSIRRLTEELQQIVAQSEQSAQPGNPANGNGSGPHENPEGEVVEGEFHDA